MDQKVEEQLLFDFYGELLTETQQQVLRYYYEEDLGLAEIASLTGRTRQSVYDIVRRSRKLMFRYEERLGLVTRFLENQKRIAQVRRELSELIERQDLTPEERTEELILIRDQLEAIEEN